MYFRMLCFAYGMTYLYLSLCIVYLGWFIVYLMMIVEPVLTANPTMLHLSAENHPAENLSAENLSAENLSAENLSAEKYKALVAKHRDQLKTNGVTTLPGFLTA